MAEYYASFNLGPIRWGSNTSGPLFDIRASATDYPRILEISGMVDESIGNVALVLGIGRPASLGTAKTNTLGFLAGDGVSALPGLTIGTDWTTVPTVPTRFLRRHSTAFNGFGITQFRLPFPDGLSIQPSSSIVVWVIQSNGLVGSPVGNIDINVTVDA